MAPGRHFADHLVTAIRLGSGKVTIEPKFEHGFIEALFEVAHIGLGLVDLNLRYVRVNDALASMNGVAAGDHQGRSIREVIPELADLAEPLLNHVIESKQPMIDLALDGPTPADPDVDRHFLASYYPVLDGAAVIGIGAVIFEVTEQVRAQQELRRQAHQIYESVVQDLTVAQLAFEAGDAGAAQTAAVRALASAKEIASSVLVKELFGDA